jgi:hypothetical protein
MNRKRLITLLLTLAGMAVSQHSFCQKHFLPGYIISQSGDTLRGLIDYRGWDSNPKEVNFKTEANSSPHTFTPLNIVGFHVANETYKGAIVENEVSPDHLSEIGYNRSFMLQKDTTFLLALIEGAKSLYLYKGNADKEQFYINNNGKFDLLLSKKYKEDKEGSVYEKEDRKYTQQLFLYLQDCPTITSKFAKLSYNRGSLVELFDNYYHCTSAQPTSRIQNEGIKCEYGVTAGMTSTSVNFKNSGDLKFLENTHFNHSVNPTAGLFLEFIFPRSQKKWSIYNEIAYASYKFKGTYNEPPFDRNSFIYTSTVGHSTLSMYNMLRFKYPVGPIFLYLNAGISNAYLFNETNLLAFVHIYNDQPFYTSTTAAIPYTRKYSNGFILGLGAKYHRCCLDCRYERTNGMSDVVTLGSFVNRFYMQVGYRF